MVLVCLLLGFVILILVGSCYFSSSCSISDRTCTHTHTQMRVLRNDFARYNLADDEADELDQDDYGWKIINTDVFRFPPHKSLLCAVIGTCKLLLGREVR